jgi:hypothetical protein
VPLHVPLLVNSLPSVAVSVAADAPWDVILVGVMVAGKSPAAIARNPESADAPPDARKCVVVASGPIAFGAEVPFPE